MLSLNAHEIRGWVRRGLLRPRRDARGRLRFSFQDLVLLRTLDGLKRSQIPARKVQKAIAGLRQQLPADSPMSGVHISVAGDRVVVRDGDNVWAPDSGQILFDFAVDDVATSVMAMVQKSSLPSDPPKHDTKTGEDWYRVGTELETSVPEAARAAYENAIALCPDHVDAHLNLGRLAHQAGDIGGAEEHYRRAIDLEPENAIAWFNLGVALEDQTRVDEAIDAYRLAIELDPDMADAYFNLGHLYERTDQSLLGRRYLKRFSELEEK